MYSGNNCGCITLSYLPHLGIFISYVSLFYVWYIIIMTVFLLLELYLSWLQASCYLFIFFCGLWAYIPSYQNTLSPFPLSFTHFFFTSSWYHPPPFISLLSFAFFRCDLINSKWLDFNFKTNLYLYF